MRILIEDKYTISDLQEEFEFVEELLEEHVNVEYEKHHARIDKQCKHLYNRFEEELKTIEAIHKVDAISILTGIWNALESVKVQANRMYSDMYFSLEPKPFTNKNYFWNRPRASDEDSYRCSGSTIK